MTEKVKITQSQAEVIEYLKNKWSIESIIESHVRRPFGWLDGSETLNGMLLLTLVDALRIGYEVEEEYKAGDWVVRVRAMGALIENEPENQKGYIFQVDSVNGKHVVERTLRRSTRHLIESVRHATPEGIKAEQERRVWAKIGREVGEFRDGDIGVGSSGAKWSDIIHLKKAYEDGGLKGFYPAESFISFGGGEE